MADAAEVEKARLNAEEQERKMVRELRDNAERAIEIERKLLERAESAQARDVPAALRAVADVKAKSVDKLMALTGRAPAEGQLDIGAALAALASRNLVRVNVDIGPQPQALEGTAVEEPDAR